MKSRSSVLYVSGLAARLGMTPDAVRMAVIRDRARSDPVLPPPFKIGHRLAWLEKDIDAWLSTKSQRGSVT